MKINIIVFIEFVRRKGMQLLEVLLQNYNIIFYGCVFWNLGVILILVTREMYLVSFVFGFSMLIVLILNKLIKVGKINIYGDAHKRILFMNIFLLILNIINISFNIFRYICYDIITIIREFIRMILLNYFKIEIPMKIDFYLDNIVAYVSWEVVYTTIIIMWWLYIEYFICMIFDWNREDMLLNDDELNKRLFWYFRNKFLFNLSIFCSLSWRVLFAVPLIDNYFHIMINKNLLMVLLLVFIFSVIGAIVFWIQYTVMWYWFLYKGNAE